MSSISQATPSVTVDSILRCLWKAQRIKPKRIHASLLLALSLFLCFSSRAPLVRAQEAGTAEIVINAPQPFAEFVSIAPNQQIAFSLGEESTAQLWDLSSGRLLRTIGPDESFENSAAFFPDGRTMLSGGGKGFLKIWDTRTGALLRTLGADLSGEQRDPIRKIAVSENGAIILSGGDSGVIRLWEPNRGVVARKYKQSRKVSGLALSSDGRTFISGDGESVRVWDVLSGRLVRTMESHSGAVTALAISRNGEMIASGHEDKTVRLWDGNSGRLLKTIVTGHSNSISSVALSPNGRILVSASLDKSLKVWDARSGVLLRTIGGHGQEADVGCSQSICISSLASVAFAPDGASIVAGGAQILNRWDIITGQPMWPVKSPRSRFIGIAFSEGGKFALSATEDGGMQRWDTSFGKLVSRFKNATATLWEASSVDPLPLDREFAFAPDGLTAIGVRRDNALTVFDVVSGRLINVFVGHTVDVHSVSFSPDGKSVLSAGGRDGTIRLWDVASTRLLKTLDTGPVDLVRFLPDGRRAATSHPRGIVKLWDIPLGRLLRTFDNSDDNYEQVNSIVFSSDGSTMLCASYHSLRVWDVTSGILLRKFGEHTGNINSASLSPDGRTVLSGGFFNGLKQWDVSTGSLVRALGETGWTRSIVFSKDGNLTLSEDMSMLSLWDVRNGQLLARTALFESGDWVTVTPEGFFESSENGAKLLNVVRGLEAYSIDQFRNALYRPDLVREKLTGDLRGKVKEAAAKLDLNKALATGKAPQVVIASPASEMTVTNPELAVAASVADQGGGIGKIEWRVNGTTIGVDTTSAGQPQAGNTVPARRTLALDPGENKIEVVAYNAPGVIASDPAQVVVTLQGQEAKVTPRLYVLTVGVNDYWDSRLHLAFAVPDAQALGEALRKGGQELYERVETTMLLDAQATAVGIGQAFTDLSQKVRPQDVFVFFMSGHGKTVDGRFYFIPQDFHYTGEDSIVNKGIGQDQLQQWLARIPARKSILMFDACESGTLTEDQAVRRGMEEMTAIDRLTHAMGRSILTATTDDKPAAEGIGGHGVFTYALLAGLAESQRDPDGLIDVFDLATYIDRRVPEISYDAFKIRQVPQTRIVGSNFPIVHQVAMSVPTPNAPVAIIPAKPTHVVIAPATVHQTASETAAKVIELPPGTQVRLIQTSEGWVFIARDGKPLGYVDAKTLATIQ